MIVYKNSVTDFTSDEYILDLIRKVKEGRIKKHACQDFVIYNGEWYSKNINLAPRETGCWCRITSAKEAYICNLCDCIADHATPFCPHCGAYMREAESK